MRIPSMAEIEATAKRQADELQRYIDQKMRSATSGGRVLTKADIDRITREGSEFLQRLQR